MPSKNAFFFGKKKNTKNILKRKRKKAKLIIHSTDNISTYWLSSNLTNLCIETSLPSLNTKNNFFFLLSASFRLRNFVFRRRGVRPVSERETWESFSCFRHMFKHGGCALSNFKEPLIFSGPYLNCVKIFCRISISISQNFTETNVHIYKDVIGLYFISVNPHSVDIILVIIIFYKS
jgi:hypothetical protein